MLVNVAVPNTPEHPGEIIRNGVVSAGDDVGASLEECQGIITWNCYGIRRKQAKMIKDYGGVHVVMENGHFRRDLGTCLAARDGHNGQGWTPFREMSGARFRRFGLKIEPWKTNGAHVLVCGQMGGGYSDMAMGDAWPTEVATRLLEVTERPIHYLPHKHRQKYPKVEHKRLTILDPRTPTAKALDGAHACVVWTSSKVTDALLMGVPGFYCGPRVAMQGACMKDVDRIDTPWYGPREQAFHSFAWQNWFPNEVSRGVPWQMLRDA